MRIKEPWVTIILNSIYTSAGIACIVFLFWLCYLAIAKAYP